MFTLKNGLKNIWNGNVGMRREKKIFGIGANKTGTTSLTKAMKELGYSVGEERDAKRDLIRSWGKRDFKKIIAFCHSAQFFQDEPFSLPFTYIALDQAFPKSKFILTIRDSPEQWYESVINYMSGKHGKNKLPTKKDLQNDAYIRKGFLWETACLVRKLNENDIYNKEDVIARYNSHNENVKEYFRHRPEDLLVLNVAEQDAYKKLCNFLKVTNKKKDFPWENKSSKLKIK